MMSELDEIIDINVGGELFQTYRKTLEQFPDSLLGNFERRQRFLNKDTGELYFNRHRYAFEYILYYYQSGGDLYQPSNVPFNIFIKELKFFRVARSEIEKLEIEFGVRCVDENEFKSDSKFKQIWEFLEYPNSSRPAKVYAVVSMLIIVISLILFVMESYPEFRNKKIKIVGNDTLILPNKHALNMYRVNTGVVIWFTIEFVARSLSCPNLCQYICNMGNVIDFLSILPFYLALVVNASHTRVLSVIRVIRVLRILKLSRHSGGFRILSNTFKASYEVLFLLGFFLIILVVLFSSAVYYVEMDIELTEYKSIPHSCWWAIATLTTVGYGDIAPTTIPGKIIGALTALFGIVMMSLPMPSVVDNFRRFSNKERNLKVAEEERLKELKELKRIKREAHLKEKKLIEAERKFSRMEKGRKTSILKTVFN